MEPNSIQFPEYVSVSADAFSGKYGVSVEKTHNFIRNIAECMEGRFSTKVNDPYEPTQSKGSYLASKNDMVSILLKNIMVPKGTSEFEMSLELLMMAEQYFHANNPYMSSLDTHKKLIHTVAESVNIRVYGQASRETRSSDMDLDGCCY